MNYAMKLAAPLILTTLTTAQVAQAGSPTGTMNVSGNVQGSCTVSAVAMNFGSITPGSATDAEGSIGVACTTGKTYTITIDGGSSLIDTNRHLAEAESENYLEYIISIDGSRSVDSYTPANGALVSNAVAGEVFYAVSSSSLNFGSVSISAGRFFDSYAFVKLDCENLSQHPQNKRVHLHIKPGPLCPLAENQAADGPGLVFEGSAADPHVVAPLSLKPPEKARLNLTFPARLRLGPQTPTGGLEFQCVFDVAYEATP
jgi:hypothetical protein